jgi:hypothetical protein
MPLIARQEQAGPARVLGRRAFHNPATRPSACMCAMTNHFIPGKLCQQRCASITTSSTESSIWRAGMQKLICSLNLAKSTTWPKGRLWPPRPDYCVRPHVQYDGSALVMPCLLSLAVAAVTHSHRRRVNDLSTVAWPRRHCTRWLLHHLQLTSRNTHWHFTQAT